MRFAGSISAFMMVAGLATLLGAPGASAQVRGNPRLTPVEEAVADTGPLSASERLMPQDLRVPASFDRVYRLSGKAGQFARVNGAITAVFPRSQYVVTSSGAVPEIPPGTTFYIGGLPEGLATPPELRTVNAPNFAGESAREVPRAKSANTYMPPALPSSLAISAMAHRTETMFNDDLFRRMRVGDLLNQAAEADVAQQAR